MRVTNKRSKHKDRIIKQRCARKINNYSTNLFEVQSLRFEVAVYSTLAELEKIEL